MKATTPAANGPLTGLRVVEFASIGPGPHCAMLLADLGAEVVRIDREGGNGWPNVIADRGRSVVSKDIRSEEGRQFCLELLEYADVVLEGFRPGVMERLGMGPDVICQLNPKIIYSRMTGWGQEGPLSQTAGHDINYIALTGALAAIGKAGEPAAVPLNLIGDFGGGSMFLAVGVLAALWEREKSGKGQVIDAAIVDGVNSLMSMFSGLVPNNRISVERDKNILGGAAPFYRCYKCADGREISLGALEPQFYRQFLEKINAPIAWLDDQNDATNWAERSEALAEIFLTKTAQQWWELLEGTDACVAPVVELTDAPFNPHLAARQSFIEIGGVYHPAPAPRFSRTPGAVRASEMNGEAMLEKWKIA